VVPVIARDSFAAGQLVYAWPFPIGQECEVACADDEQVVMCPAWTIGARLGPGRHRWRTPDPTRPVSAYFVSFGPVDVDFDMVTQFPLPGTAQPIQIKASGTVAIRCGDPAVLIAQFIGLPFDSIDQGIRRSVARSVERMVARLLTRRVVLGGTIAAITDPSMLQPIIAEIASYNPTAGAVFGVELAHLSRLFIEASDGRVRQVSPRPESFGGAEESSSPSINGWEDKTREAPVPHAVAQYDTQRGVGSPAAPSVAADGAVSGVVSGVVSGASSGPSSGPSSGAVAGVVSGSISPPRPAAPAKPPPIPRRRPSAETLPPPMPAIPAPPRARAEAVSVPTPADKPPQPDISAEGSSPRAVRLASEPDPRSSILAIGARIGDRHVTSGEIPVKVAPGKRVLVPGPHGLMQSATVRQLLSGYYELELGASGETIWVPMAHVVPE
jgi:hypothetical protein